jgi:hypothetical protein
MPTKNTNPKTPTNAPLKETRNGEGDATGHAHLIRIADAEARRRAIMAFGQAREPYCGFTDFRLLVTNEHLEILRHEAIPFELLS